MTSHLTEPATTTAEAMTPACAPSPAGLALLGTSQPLSAALWWPGSALQLVLTEQGTAP